MTFTEYKEQLLSYLRKEKELTERDIQNHAELSEEEKVEQGYLIKKCQVSIIRDGCTELIAKENNTKLRAGDKVKLIDINNGRGVEASVIENSFDRISVNVSLQKTSQYDIIVKEGFYLDPLISVLDYLEEGGSGTTYIKELCNQEAPVEVGYDPIDVNDVNIPTDLNQVQRLALEKVLKRPSLYCIQGPPGTGKPTCLQQLPRFLVRMEMRC